MARSGSQAIPGPPEPPPEADPLFLPSSVRRELGELPPGRRETALRHLAGAARLLDEDPQAAHQHAMAARQLAPRSAYVREAAGITAYRTGHWADAMRDLRAYARITGDVAHLALLADCERALGRPERALALAAGSDAERLDRAARVELRIVVSGARRDRGEYDAALVALRGPDLDDPDVHPWTARLWYAYAAALLDAGQAEEALCWFEATATVDPAGATDATERAADLKRALFHRD